MEAIRERQLGGEREEYPILNIYPEGCTTNGSALIKFKKGAFYNLRPVRPSTLKYYSPGISSSQDVAGFLYHTLLTSMCFYITIQNDILPVFAPNEFFWKNHWDEKKEEKWEAYARVVRDVMADHLGKPVCDLAMEDKFTYSLILKGQVKASKEE